MTPIPEPFADLRERLVDAIALADRQTEAARAEALSIAAHDFEIQGACYRGCLMLLDAAIKTVWHPMHDPEKVPETHDEWVEWEAMRLLIAFGADSGQLLEFCRRHAEEMWERSHRPPEKI